MRRFGRRVGGGEAARGGEGDDRRAGFLRALDLFEPHRGAALAQSSASFVDDDSGTPDHHVGIAAKPADPLERAQLAFPEDDLGIAVVSYTTKCKNDVEGKSGVV